MEYFDCNFLLEKENVTAGANNESNSTDCSYEDFLLPEEPYVLVVTRTILLVVYTIVCVVGLCGNSMVIFVVLRFMKMKTVTNLYILNLALSDEMFLIGIPFVVITSELHTWIFGEVVCKLYMMTSTASQFTSSISLLVMSFDRYIVLCYPLKSMRWRTCRRATGLCICVWILAISMSVTVVIYSRIVVEPTGVLVCTVIWPKKWSSTAADTAYTVYAFILGFAVPVGLTMVFYIQVVRALRTRSLNSALLRKTAGQKVPFDTSSSERKVTKMVLTVIAVYIFCWLPYWILQVTLFWYSPRSSIVLYIFCVVYSLAYGNSCMNPFLYAFQSQSFRKSFIAAFRCANASAKNLGFQSNTDNTNYTAAALTGRQRLRAASFQVLSMIHENAPVVRPLLRSSSFCTLGKHDELQTPSFKNLLRRSSDTDIISEKVSESQLNSKPSKTLHLPQNRVNKSRGVSNMGNTLEVPNNVPHFQSHAVDDGRSNELRVPLQNHCCNVEPTADHPLLPQQHADELVETLVVPFINTNTNSSSSVRKHKNRLYHESA